jgi:hypothetical protein
MATQTFITTGQTTWTVPSGITSIQVECYGAGGGGSITGGVKSSGGGGGGYAKVYTLSVTPGQIVYVNVGAGGAAAAGGNSWVNKVSNAQPTVTTSGCCATGGGSGVSGNGTVGGNLVGDVGFAGGAGG